jgi:hypothetical protein
VNPGAITPEEAPIVADPDSERGLDRRRDCRLGRLAREEDGEKQGEEHGASRDFQTIAEK